MCNVQDGHYAGSCCNGQNRGCICLFLVLTCGTPTCQWGRVLRASEVPSSCSTEEQDRPSDPHRFSTPFPVIDNKLQHCLALLRINTISPYRHSQSLKWEALEKYYGWPLLDATCAWCYHQRVLAKDPLLHTELCQKRATTKSTVNPSLPLHFDPHSRFAHPQTFRKVHCAYGNTVAQHGAWSKTR